MKTIDLTQQTMNLGDLLHLASQDSLFVLSDDGHQYLVEEADEFDMEVAMLGKSDRFKKFLEERSREKATTSIDELEKRLKL